MQSYTYGGQDKMQQASLGGYFFPPLSMNNFLDWPVNMHFISRAKQRYIHINFFMRNDMCYEKKHFLFLKEKYEISLLMYF